MIVTGNFSDSIIGASNSSIQFYPSTSAAAGSYLTAPSSLSSEVWGVSGSNQTSLASSAQAGVAEVTTRTVPMGTDYYFFGYGSDQCTLIAALKKKYPHMSGYEPFNRAITDYAQCLCDSRHSIGAAYSLAKPAMEAALGIVSPADTAHPHALLSAERRQRSSAASHQAYARIDDLAQEIKTQQGVVDAHKKTSNAIARSIKEIPKRASLPKNFINRLFMMRREQFNAWKDKEHAQKLQLKNALQQEFALSFQIHTSKKAVKNLQQSFQRALEQDFPVYAMLERAHVACEEGDFSGYHTLMDICKRDDPELYTSVIESHFALESGELINEKCRRNCASALKEINLALKKNWDRAMDSALMAISGAHLFEGYELSQYRRAYSQAESEKRNYFYQVGQYEKAVSNANRQQNIESMMYLINTAAAVHQLRSEQELYYVHFTYKHQREETITTNEDPLPTIMAAGEDGVMPDNDDEVTIERSVRKIQKEDFVVSKGFETYAEAQEYLDNRHYISEDTVAVPYQDTIMKISDTALITNVGIHRSRPDRMVQGRGWDNVIAEGPQHEGMRNILVGIRDDRMEQQSMPRLLQLRATGDTIYTDVSASRETVVCSGSAMTGVNTFAPVGRTNNEGISPPNISQQIISPTKDFESPGPHSVSLPQMSSVRANDALTRINPDVQPNSVPPRHAPSLHAPTSGSAPIVLQSPEAVSTYQQRLAQVRQNRQEFLSTVEKTRAGTDCPAVVIPVKLPAISPATNQNISSQNINPIKRSIEGHGRYRGSPAQLSQVQPDPVLQSVRPKVPRHPTPEPLPLLAQTSTSSAPIVATPEEAELAASEQRAQVREAFCAKLKAMGSKTPLLPAALRAQCSATHRMIQTLHRPDGWMSPDAAYVPDLIALLPGFLDGGRQLLIVAPSRQVVTVFDRTGQLNIGDIVVDAPRYVFVRNEDHYRPLLNHVGLVQIGAIRYVAGGTVEDSPMDGYCLTHSAVAVELGAVAAPGMPDEEIFRARLITYAQSRAQVLEGPVADSIEIGKITDRGDALLKARRLAEAFAAANPQLPPAGQHSANPYRRADALASHSPSATRTMRTATLVLRPPSISPGTSSAPIANSKINSALPGTSDVHRSPVPDLHPALPLAPTSSSAAIVQPSISPSAQVGIIPNQNRAAFLATLGKKNARTVLPEKAFEQAHPMIHRMIQTLRSPTGWMSADATYVPLLIARLPHFLDNGILIIVTPGGRVIKSYDQTGPISLSAIAEDAPRYIIQQEGSHYSAILGAVSLKPSVSAGYLIKGGTVKNILSQGYTLPDAALTARLGGNSSLLERQTFRASLIANAQDSAQEFDAAVARDILVTKTVKANELTANQRAARQSVAKRLADARFAIPQPPVSLANAGNLNAHSPPVAVSPSDADRPETNTSALQTSPAPLAAELSEAGIHQRKRKHNAPVVQSLQPNIPPEFAAWYADRPIRAFGEKWTPFIRRVKLAPEFPTTMSDDILAAAYKTSPLIVIDAALHLTASPEQRKWFANQRRKGLEERPYMHIQRLWDDRDMNDPDFSPAILAEMMGRRKQRIVYAIKRERPAFPPKAWPEGFDPKPNEEKSTAEYVAELRRDPERPADLSNYQLLQVIPEEYLANSSLPPASASVYAREPAQAPQQPQILPAQASESPQQMHVSDQVPATDVLINRDTSLDPIKVESDELDWEKLAEDMYMRQPRFHEGLHHRTYNDGPILRDARDPAKSLTQEIGIGPDESIATINVSDWGIMEELISQQPAPQRVKEEITQSLRHWLASEGHHSALIDALMVRTLEEGVVGEGVAAARTLEPFTALGFYAGVHIEDIGGMALDDARKKQGPWNDVAYTWVTGTRNGASLNAFSSANILASVNTGKYLNYEPRGENNVAMVRVGSRKNLLAYVVTKRIEKNKELLIDYGPRYNPNYLGLAGSGKRMENELRALKTWARNTSYKQQKDADILADARKAAILGSRSRGPDSRSKVAKLEKEAEETKVLAAEILNQIDTMNARIALANKEDEESLKRKQEFLKIKQEFLAGTSEEGI